MCLWCLFYNIFVIMNCLRLTILLFVVIRLCYYNGDCHLSLYIYCVVLCMYCVCDCVVVAGCMMPFCFWYVLFCLCVAHCIGCVWYCIYVVDVFLYGLVLGYMCNIYIHTVIVCVTMRIIYCVFNWFDAGCCCYCCCPCKY